MLSPVFGASVVLLGVSGVVGCSGVGSSGVSGTSVIVTVCPSSSMEHMDGDAYEAEFGEVEE